MELPDIKQAYDEYVENRAISRAEKIKRAKPIIDDLIKGTINAIAEGENCYHTWVSREAYDNHAFWAKIDIQSRFPGYSVTYERFVFGSEYKYKILINGWAKEENVKRIVEAREQLNKHTQKGDANGS